MGQDWHQSAIEDYWVCGERFRRNHLTGEVRGDAATNLQGTAVHEVMAKGLQYLMDTGVLVTAEFMGTEALLTFKRLIGEDQKSEDPIPFTDESFLARMAEVEVMASALWAKVPGLLETYGAPLSIEQTFSGVPVGSSSIAGTWDVVTEDGYILDWKTSRSSWRPGIENAKIQPIVYARGVEYVTGNWPAGFVFVVVNRNGDVRIKPVNIPREKLVFLEHTLRELEKAREHEVYPMNPSSGLCSETYCTWFRRGCPAAILKDAA